jgi:formate hydrogenlyase transcriptional activator
LQADVRLLYSTHQDLKRAVAEGRFREDLFWRVHVYPIRLPSLRERKADIPLLARRFLERQSRRWGWPVPRLTSSFLAALQAHSWPGNVRELENVLCQVLLTTRGVEVLGRAHVQGLVPESAQEPVSTPLASAVANLQAPDVIPRDDLLRMYYQRVCELTQGVVYGEQGAGRLLGMSGEKLSYWLRKLGLR